MACTERQFPLLSFWPLLLFQQHSARLEGCSQLHAVCWHACFFCPISSHPSGYVNGSGGAWRLKSALDTEGTDA
ncbi:hypothetical protein KP509_20G064200 [Ceratopteris richardii]|uniref:Secreted protein n=1 Tax=Ceratopteris richardii TaxID=49495 RepID=A0A8T2SHQ4_CERRI|nr:hypothetical protein KP509_20G064200 [Ceratopteris richardii]